MAAAMSSELLCDNSFVLPAKTILYSFFFLFFLHIWGKKMGKRGGWGSRVKKEDGK